MGYGEKRGSYYRGRFKIAPGRYGTVQDERGGPRKFRTKREAKQAADAEEVEVRSGQWRDPNVGRVTFGAYANEWFVKQDLAASTMANYRRHLEEHLLPKFEHHTLADITAVDADTWEQQERSAGYAESSIRTWRATLHLILADAVSDGLIRTNPATKRRGRGRRAGKSKTRQPEKATTDALGALLIAERAALLSGRDAEFVLTAVMAYTGMRWGELVGLETRYARLGSIRVEWQCYELATELVRCPPKDDSYRDVDLPNFLSALVSDHVTRTSPRACECHGQTYVFSGRNGAAHWSRSGFATWVFQPATSGWFPAKSPQPTRPVPLTAEPWPGTPVRGRNAQGRGEMYWLPIAPGLTPHGLRHSHKTAMVEDRVPEIFQHERLGHQMDGIGARYSHVTSAMRKELCDALTERWEASLDARAAMHPHSPVVVLDELLQARQHKKKGEPREGSTKIFSQDSPKAGVYPLQARPQKGA